MDVTAISAVTSLGGLAINPVGLDVRLRTPRLFFDSSHIAGTLLAAFAMLYTAARAAVLVLAVGYAAEPAASLSIATSRTGVQRLSVPVMQSPLAEGANDAGCGCEEASGGVMMNEVRVTGETLRSMVLADRTGNRVTAETLIGSDGKAVVCFLRHLG